ncbi:MAG TPA: MFS transporter [Rubrivivax sp.]|nr:MFS transporter [Rubrivivax sp.]
MKWGRFLPRLAEGDLLRDRVYRRLWTSILTSSFGNQVMMLALPLTAAVLLQATPTQMGLLTAIELLPFLLFSLPSGVWLDRVRKLPVYIVGETAVALAAASVPLAWWLGWLSMGWLYVVGFVLGTVHTVAGTAAQIVLMQVVARDRLVEAHAKNALASSGAEVAGPGLAGALIKVFGAPVALLVNAALLLMSALILRGLHVEERRHVRPTHFWRDLMAGLHFVAGTPLLVTLGVLMGVWQMCHYAASTVQILFATRTLGLNEHQIGLCYIGMGVGTIAGSVLGRRVSVRIGPGPCLVVGYAICGAGWLLLALAPANVFGALAFALMLVSFTTGAVFIFINFLALRQAVTPGPLLGRMTSTMRWLTLLAAAPGALLGGWLGEHVGLRASLGFAAGVSALLVLVAWRLPVIRSLKALPAPDHDSDWMGAEAGPGALPAADAER